MVSMDSNVIVMGLPQSLDIFLDGKSICKWMICIDLPDPAKARAAQEEMLRARVGLRDPTIAESMSVF